MAGQLQDEPALLRQALEAATAIGDDKGRADALAAVAGQLQGKARQQCLREAVEAAAGIWDETDRAGALQAVVWQLQDEPEIWRGVLREAERLTGFKRHWVLSDLIDGWNSSLGYSDLLQMLDAMGISSRRDWFQLVEELAPVIVMLGGKKAVEETVVAIHDVAAWWP